MPITTYKCSVCGELCPDKQDKGYTECPDHRGPNPGEVYRLKKSGRCETRHVTDRTGGRGVVFQPGRYNPWMHAHNHEMCSLEDWNIWRAQGAKLIRKDA